MDYDAFLPDAPAEHGDEQDTAAVLYTVGGGDELARFAEWLHKKRVCARCSTEFTEYDNLGRWQCAQHARPLVPPETVGGGPRVGWCWGTPGHWDCCNRPLLTRHTMHGFFSEAAGCIAADHIAAGAHQRFTEADTVRIPPELAGAVQLWRESHREDPADPHTVLVLRFDADRARTVAAFGIDARLSTHGWRQDPLTSPIPPRLWRAY